MHYNRLRRTGTTKVRPKARCSVNGCEEKHIARGFCRLHYDQVRRGVINEKTLKRRCRVPGCNRPHKRGGFCQYLKWSTDSCAPAPSP